MFEGEYPAFHLVVLDFTAPPLSQIRVSRGDSTGGLSWLPTLRENLSS